MARLPTPGADSGQWGDILNDYLAVEHNIDGSLKKAGDIATALSTAQSKYTKPTAGIPEADLASTVQDKLNTAGSGNVADGTITTAKLANLNVTTDKLANGAVTNAKLDSGTQATLTSVAGKADTSAVNAKYTKPGAGIPATDLTTGAQSSLAKADSALQAADITGKANDNAVVHLSGAETITGVKTYSASPVVPTPGSGTQAANKSYVDGLATKTGTVPFSQSGSAATGASGTWRAPVAGTITRVTVMTATAPVGSNLIVQFYKNVTLVSTQTINAGSTTDATATLSTTFAAGDKLSVNATSVGSATAATNVTVQFDYTY